VPKPDFPPADVVAYNDEMMRFAAHGRKDEWQCFLLWRIAESLSELAGAEWMRAAKDDEDPGESWRGTETDEDE
jgi:hypothetical protein